jgi:hypothetical protein
MEFTLKQDKERFNPITITITLENVAELKSMWVRLNKSDTWTDDNPKAKGAKLNCYSLWNALDDILQEYM